MDLQEDSPELFELIRSMMRRDPGTRVSAEQVCRHGVVVRAKQAMERRLAAATRKGGNVCADPALLLAASPLFGESPLFLEEILGREEGRAVHKATEDDMDVSA